MIQAKVARRSSRSERRRAVPVYPERRLAGHLTALSKGLAIGAFSTVPEMCRGQTRGCVRSIDGTSPNARLPHRRRSRHEVLR